mmetsp:Transcript_7548/g.11938  ORF Transcript_7548/g.11938 Transcript_7548/m.11938 type:complete len:92 (+) Transcript_7548:27-302(+)
MPKVQGSVVRDCSLRFRAWVAGFGAEGLGLETRSCGTSGSRPLVQGAGIWGLRSIFWGLGSRVRVTGLRVGFWGLGSLVGRIAELNLGSRG